MLIIHKTTTNCNTITLVVVVTVFPTLSHSFAGCGGDSVRVSGSEYIINPAPATNVEVKCFRAINNRLIDG